jgi:hypothetical protein
MSHEFKFLESSSSEQFSELVTRHLAEGWDLWGNPVVQEAMYDGDVYDVHFFQAVVRMIERPNAGRRMAQETAGYTVQVPILEEHIYKPSFVTERAAWLPEKCQCFEVAGDNHACPIHGEGSTVRPMQETGNRFHSAIIQPNENKP